MNEQRYLRKSNSNNSRNMSDIYSGYATAQRQSDGSAFINVRLQRPDNNLPNESKEQAKHGFTHYFAVGFIIGLILLGLFTLFIIGLILLVMIL